MQKIHHTIKEQIYQYLKGSIMLGDFKMGSQIKEVEIAEKLSVSRTPVHDVVVQLVKDGLLTTVPNKGVYVRRFTPKDVKEIIEARIVLEGRGMQCLIFGRELDMERLRGIYERMVHAFETNDLFVYSDADFSLHREIVSYSDNQIIIEFNSRINSLTNMLLNISLKHGEDYQTSHKEHVEIVEHLLNGEFEKAWDADRNHLIRACDELVAFVSWHP